MAVTLGQLLVNEALPEEYRDYSRMLSKGEADELLARIAKDHPEDYKEISHRLVQLGREASYTEGSTLRLSDLRAPFDKTDLIKHVREQEDLIRNNDKLSAQEKEDALNAVYSEMQAFIVDQTYEQALAQNNAFATQVKSKARGNKSQLAMLLSTPSVYQDAQDRTIPVFIGHSYAEGLDPAEYWAATYGARKGVISTKFATRDAGALGKQFGVAVADMVVTGEDCETTAGIPVDTDDDDNLGAELAAQVGDFPAGTVINKEVLAELRKSETPEILIRSPITCGYSQGVCKHCTGLRENGKYPEIGHHVGFNAASALAEQIAQSSLNQKHCLTRDTLVLCADFTVKRMDELRVGEWIMGADNAGRMAPTRIVEVFDNGPKDCYRTSFRPNGQRAATAESLELCSTLDHKLLATRRVSSQKAEANNWQLRQLAAGCPGKYFYAVRPSSFDDTGRVREDMALLCGLLLGDGCYTEAVKGIFLSSADQALIAELTPYLTSMNLSIRKVKDHEYYYRVAILEDSANQGPDGRMLPGARNPAKQFLRRYGMYGKYAPEKQIPAVVHEWDNASVAQLIAGLIITDGSIYACDESGKPGIAFKSTSYALISQLRYLMSMRFGIYPSNLTKTSRAGDCWGTSRHNHDAYQFTITSWPQVVKFLECIPLLGAKLARLSELVSAYTGQARNNFCGVRRVLQEYIGPQYTMDLQVDNPDHLFVLANGLIVSNSGGQKDSKGNIVFSGFDVINNLTAVPKNFPNHATVATADGTVDKIEPAAQGGNNVYINGEPHYVSPDLPVFAKVGDTVEAGDQLSDGILNPADVVKYKGVGEGRRYLAERLTQAFRDSSYGVNRRNVEVLARSMVDHVNVDEPEGLGHYLPGDVVSYSGLAYSYKPRKDSKLQDVSNAVGQYLEQPALHYTIGTRITPSVVKRLKQYGVNSVTSHSQPAGFHPAMVSLTKAPQYKDDWMARLGTTYLKPRLLQDVHRGAESKPHGLNPIPSLARGVEFGEPKDKSKGFAY